MRFLTFILFFVFITNAGAQQLSVGSVKNATFSNGQLLKVNDKISVQNKVIIQKEGGLNLINKTGWSFYLREGTFDLDSCYKANTYLFRDYDSVKVIIDTIFPNGVSGKFNYVCRTMALGDVQGENYSQGNIAFLNTNSSDVIIVSSNSVTIYWRDPKKYSGRYIVTVENMYDDVIGYRISTTTNLYINRLDFPYVTQGIFVTVYSEDGRKSSRVPILKK